MLHTSPHQAIILGLGFLASLSLGYFLGEMLLRLAKRYALRRSNERIAHQNVDVEARVAAAEAETLARIREIQKERLNEGARRVNLMPLVSYEGVDFTSHSRECVICLEDFEEGDLCRIVLGCNHAFHAQCADDWLKKKQRCPLCRREI